jgi:hypothetical protein
MKKHGKKSICMAIYEAIGKHNIMVLNFTYNGYEYLITLTRLCNAWIYWEYHKNRWNLRVRLNARQKERLIHTAGCIRLGKTEDVFNSNSDYNKGDQIEAIIYTAMTGKAWKKDYTPWYEGADIELPNGIMIQVKRENATITNMNRLQMYM